MIGEIHMEEKDNQLMREIKRLIKVEEEQSRIIEKQTGQELYPLLDADKDGNIILDSDNPHHRKIWETNRD